MGILREWLIRLRGTFRPSRRDDDMEEELRLHAELANEYARRDGRSPERAARAVAIDSGAVAQSMEALRDQRGVPWLADLLRDVRHACRLLRRNPVFAAVAHAVARRTREIGIRMAIGADKSDVLKMVLRQGLALSIAGIGVGGIASVVFVRLLTAALAGIGTTNPATYVIVPSGSSV